jgi:hypothetical protein
MLICVLALALTGASGALQPLPAQNPPEKGEAAPPPGPRIKLILKDGSHQLVRAYERRGERVRYYSAERMAWEELPAELVDWEATRKGEEQARQQLAEIESRMKEIRQEQIAEEVDVDASLEIAPGVFLPDEPGMYILEGKTTKRLELMMAEVKVDKGRVLTKILVPVPIIPARHKARLAGGRAANRVATPNPEFYVRFEGGREPDLELMRAESKGSYREFASISTWFTGEKVQNRKMVSVEKWQLARGVFRLTLSESLPPGEYVLAEIVPDEGINMAVWDFGVDAAGKTGASKKKK